MTHKNDRQETSLISGLTRVNAKWRVNTFENWKVYAICKGIWNYRLDASFNG